MAFLDDVHVVTTPPRVADSHAHLDRALWEHAGIINQGKTQIFNRGGVFPPGCQHILRAGRRQLTPPVVVWRGDSALPSDQQGVGRERERKTLTIPLLCSIHKKKNFKLVNIRRS